MSKFLVGTGFWASEEDHERKRRFLDLWLKNTAGHDVVIVDNSVLGLQPIEGARIVRINKNLGHPDDFKGQFRPHLLGCSISWIIPAMMAYSEGFDFVYKEQDSLWFGDVAGELVRRAETSDVVAQLGYARSAPAKVESALMWIRHEFIIEFITKYMEVPQGDGLVTVEEKIEHVAIQDKRVVPVGFGVGRDRPLPIGHRVWYAQRITDDEIERLSKAGLL